jgi:hypothetical protein
MTRPFLLRPGTGGPALRSIGKPAASYPGAIASDQHLAIAVDRQQTKLTVPMSTTDTTMAIADPTMITVWSLLSIDSEIVQVTGAPVGNVVPVTRAFDGTAAAIHLTGTTVAGLIDAYHHNTLVAEVEAIENALGPNLSRVPQSYFAISAAFQFTQTPNVALTVGTNVITLTPVPPGIYGNDANHYVYISGGTGTAEACLITGGTAVGGAASGTLFFTCAYAHSGAWTIQSGTAGIQEAASYLNTGNGGTVWVPQGNWQIYAPITISGYNMTISGFGPESGSLLTINLTSGTAITFNGTYSTFALANLEITTPSQTPKNLVAVEINANYAFYAEDLHIYGFFKCFSQTGFTNAAFIQRCFMAIPYTDGVAISLDSNSAGNLFIISNSFAAYSSNHFYAGVSIGRQFASDGVWISNNGFYQCQNGLLINPGTGRVGQVFSLGNGYNSCDQYAINITPSAPGYMRSFVSIGDNIEVGNNGIQIGGLSGSVDGVTIDSATVNNNKAAGIVLGTGTINATLSNCIVGGNSTTTANAYPGVAIAAGVSRWVITGGIFGQSANGPNNQSYGIQVSAGASDYYAITGAYIPMNVSGGLLDQGTGVHKVIANNVGVDTLTPPAIASSATLALPATDAPVINLTGTTTVTAITGGWIGRKLVIYKTDAGTVTVMGRSLAQNTSIQLISPDGTNWY